AGVGSNMGHFSMEKPPNPGSVLGGNQQDVVRQNCSRAEILGFLHEKYQLAGNLKELRSERDQVVRLDAGPAGIFTLRISHFNEKPANLQCQTASKTGSDAISMMPA